VNGTGAHGGDEDVVLGKLIGEMLAEVDHRRLDARIVRIVRAGLHADMDEILMMRGDADRRSHGAAYRTK